MARHRRSPEQRPSHPRPLPKSGLSLGRRERWVLGFCILGLLIAWTAYGIAGAHAGDGTGRAPLPISGEAGGTTGGFSSPGPLEPSATSSTSPEEPTAPSTEAPTAATQAPVSPPEAAAAAPASSIPPAAAPLRITYPHAGMDVVIHPLTPDGSAAANQSIEPPETMDGYWLVPFGIPGAGSTNTTYVVGHSWLDRDAPFNHLSWASAAGDEFTVTTATGVMTYRVDSVATYSKATLKDSPIWEVVPNRLVLVSCYSEDPWGRNVTVVASPVPGR